MRLITLSSLALMTLAGQVLLLAGAWILPSVSDYGLKSDTISEHVLGSYGFFQTAGFVVAVFGTLGQGRHRALRDMRDPGGGSAFILQVNQTVPLRINPWLE